MSVRYHKRNKKMIPDYVCSNAAVKHGTKRCQDIPGATIEKAINDLIIDMLTPLNLQTAIRVQREIESRLQQADQIRHQHVERARYEADLAKRRFMLTDPNNRLVADVLEADWNDKLRTLVEAQAIYEKECKAERQLLGEEQQRLILKLAKDLPALWKAPETLVRIDMLLAEHTDGETAAILNAEGIRSATGILFTRDAIRSLRLQYSLKTCSERLREKGYLSAKQLSALTGISPQSLPVWRRKGLLKGTRINDNGQHVYEQPTAETLKEVQRRLKYTKSKSPAALDVAVAGQRMQPL